MGVFFLSFFFFFFFFNDHPLQMLSLQGVGYGPALHSHEFDKTMELYDFEGDKNVIYGSLKRGNIFIS